MSIISVSVLYSNYYSIKWYHDLNLHSNPCDDKLISVFLEGGKRTLSKPIIKKDPITPSCRNSAKEMYLKSQETGHVFPLVLAITTLFPRLYTSVFPDTMFTTI
jgi:hypothetical protein